jgi:hypothetical protein
MPQSSVIFAYGPVLPQVVVAAAGPLSDTERWLGFYDIFVRHAFGNYGDVLKETVYSPVIGEWLRCALQPFTDSFAHAHRSASFRAPPRVRHSPVLYASPVPAVKAAPPHPRPSLRQLRLHALLRRVWEVPR